ncbi:hypothetical protein LINPERHAP2_LOCUS3232 [Linum perenne]
MINELHLFHLMLIKRSLGIERVYFQILDVLDSHVLVSGLIYRLDRRKLN